MDSKRAAEILRYRKFAGPDDWDEARDLGAQALEAAERARDEALWAANPNADSARAWLAARDAYQRREGAAEWFTAHRDYNLSALEQMEKFAQAAKRLREAD